ncbi:unnamed protein product [Adineta steineri]|uniref:Uncharacterized protein n=1 Tax=Adineta steineri TaxID=433720 RepID=A0A816CQ22_9BILA|nr:unnamed protein product [Adineta steineri]CAF1626430.1 unnamed protein product [Adineta steineri]
MVLYVQNSSLIRPRGSIIMWCDELSTSEALMDNIQAIELDMSQCGQYDNSIEKLTEIKDRFYNEEALYKHEWYNLQIKPPMYSHEDNTSKMLIEEKIKRKIRRLYTLRGLLLYRDRKYQEALEEFNKVLGEYNSNDVQLEFYTIFAYDMLGEYSKANFSIEKYIEKYRTDTKNIQSQSILAKLNDYYAIIRKNHDKRLRQEAEKYREVNSASSKLFMNMWPTHIEFAELSNVAYCKLRLPLLPLWTFIDECNDIQHSGYYGIAVQHTETKEIVFAHRGTVFDVNNASLIADYHLFILQIPDQFRVAQQFTNKLREKIDPKQILWHTGHSLGAAIAEFLVANDTLFEQKLLSFAVTFDSPGIMEILKAHYDRKMIKHDLLKPDEFRIISYLSAPNIINTMGTHIGLVLSLSPPLPLAVTYGPLAKRFYDYFTTSFQQFKGIIDIFVEQLHKQLHWHNLGTIIECFKAWPNENGLPTIIKPVIKWPKGPQELVGFIHLAYEHNLTSLDISWYAQNDMDKVLNAFEKCNYNVVHNPADLPMVLPLTFWNRKAQSFLKQIINDDFKKTNVTKQLSLDCELIKFIGIETMKIIINILYWKEETHRYNNMEMITLNESAIPNHNGKMYNINMLTIFKLFSLFDVDNCLVKIIDEF